MIDLSTISHLQDRMDAAHAQTGGRGDSVTVPVERGIVGMLVLGAAMRSLKKVAGCMGRIWWRVGESMVG